MQDILNSSEELNPELMYEFLIKRHIEQFLNGVIPDSHPISDRVSYYGYGNLPNIGSHLETSRWVYTHHGIYIGNEEVIHYSGLADGFKSGPVEKTSLSTFLVGNDYKIILHSDTKYSQEKIVERATRRLGESDYNLLFNNCEHFAYWCFYNVNSSNQINRSCQVLGGPIRGVMNVNETSKHLYAYMRGDIKSEKLLKEINNLGVTTVSTVLYAGLGQIAIPIPIVGAFIGAIVGSVIGNLLTQSGLIALGDSDIVKISKERRKKIEYMCDLLIPQIEKSRLELERYIDKYFSDRKEIFENSFNTIELSLHSNNSEQLYSSLNTINNQFGKSIRFKNAVDLRQHRKSGKKLIF